MLIANSHFRISSVGVCGLCLLVFCSYLWECVLQPSVYSLSYLKIKFSRHFLPRPGLRFCLYGSDGGSGQPLPCSPLPLPFFPLSPISAKPLLLPPLPPHFQPAGHPGKNTLFLWTGRRKGGQNTGWGEASIQESTISSSFWNRISQIPISVKRVGNKMAQVPLFWLFWRHSFDFEPNVPLQLAPETVTSGIRMLRNSLDFSPLWGFL